MISWSLHWLPLNLTLMASLQEVTPPNQDIEPQLVVFTLQVVAFIETRCVN